MENSPQDLSQEQIDAIIESPPQYHLTKKNILFCKYYTDLSNMDTFGNGLESAIKAGYSVSNAGDTAHNMLQKSIIQQEIARIESEYVQQTSFTRAEFLKILIAKANSTRSEAVQARYWEMVGRCKGGKL